MTAADALRRLPALAERVRLIRRAFDRKDNRYADVCALADEIERLALDGLAGDATVTCLNSFLGGIHGPARPIVVNGLCEACATKQATETNEPTEQGQP